MIIEWVAVRKTNLEWLGKTGNQLALMRRSSVQAIAAIVGPPGRPGLSGDAALQYTHTQSVASDTWVVNHNKGYRPNAIVYSIGWIEIEAAIIHTSENQILVQLNSPMTGYVIA